MSDLNGLKSECTNSKLTHALTKLSEVSIIINGKSKVSSSITIPYTNFASK